MIRSNAVPQMPGLLATQDEHDRYMASVSNRRPTPVMGLLHQSGVATPSIPMGSSNISWKVKKEYEKKFADNLKEMRALEEAKKTGRRR